MMRMGPPQQGHGGAMPVVAAAGSPGDVSAASCATGAAASSNLRISASFALRWAVGEKAIMTDALEPFGKNVQQEAADKLVGIKCHALLLRAVRGSPSR